MRTLGDRDLRKSSSATPHGQGPSVWSLLPAGALTRHCPYMSSSSASRSPSPHVKLSPAPQASARVLSCLPLTRSHSPAHPVPRPPCFLRKMSCPPLPEEVSRASGTTKGCPPGEGIRPLWRAGPPHLCVTAVRSSLVTESRGGNDMYIAKYLIRIL